jgi:hypothetical protein
MSKRKSSKKTDMFGNVRWEHQDKFGRRTGQRELKTNFWGEKMLERRDSQGRKTGTGAYRKDFGGKDYIENRNSKGRVTSRSYPKQEGCFLTIACTQARWLPDDCYKLQTLRRFRDEVLPAYPRGEEIVREYYELPPRIVNAIQRKANASEVLKVLYDEIETAAQLIDSARHEEAFELYLSMVFASNAAF